MRYDITLVNQRDVVQGIESNTYFNVNENLDLHTIKKYLEAKLGTLVNNLMDENNRELQLDTKICELNNKTIFYNW